MPVQANEVTRAPGHVITHQEAGAHTSHGLCGGRPTGIRSYTESCVGEGFWLCTGWGVGPPTEARADVRRKNQAVVRESCLVPGTKCDNDRDHAALRPPFSSSPFTPSLSDAGPPSLFRVLFSLFFSFFFFLFVLFLFCC